MGEAVCENRRGTARQRASARPQVFCGSAPRRSAAIEYSYACD